MKSEIKIKEFKPFTTVAGGMVLIECTLASRQIRKGTGLIYEFCQREDGSTFPALVINKHLARDARRSKLSFTRQTLSGAPDPGNLIEIICTNFWENCIPHPDPKVDLCIYPLQALLEKAEQDGLSIYLPPLETYRTPTEREIADTDAVEEIYMAGYPNSLHDSATNTPVYQTGITATGITLKYRDRPQFLIDTGIFKCSSGSPVFLVVNEVGIIDNRYVLKKTLRLVGIIGFVLNQSDQGVAQTLACEDLPREQTGQMTNQFGVVIHYSKLLDFEEMLMYRTHDHASSFSMAG